jgi:4-hydroxy-tetrahydrodipicolinate reductase
VTPSPSGRGNLLRVIVAGATGRVGRVMMDGLAQPPEIEVVGGFGSARAHQELESLAPGADVLVDFTTGAAAPELLCHAARLGLHVVSGTSGLAEQALTDVDTVLRQAGRGGVWAANFAIGAVLMMSFARVAARYMDAAEVIELHHDKKVDAPSGTAVQTARGIRAARGRDLPDPRVERWTLEGSRGAVDGGVRIHSVRLPGFNAHQEVLFGAPGQVLSIRHDALGREAYLPGVALAVREVPNQSGLVRGLDTLMGLS